MKKIHYIQDTEKFWQAHWESVKSYHEEMVKLPYEKKLEIMEKMKANHEAMRNAKRNEV